MKTSFLALAAFLGLLTGFIAFSFLYSGQNGGYCKGVEKSLETNSTFNGSVACYPPGRIDTNISDSLSGKTELRCVCRQIYRGKVHDIAIRFPG